MKNEFPGGASGDFAVAFARKHEVSKQSRKNSRTVEKLILVGDSVGEIFSDDELDMIAYALWECSLLNDAEHRAEEWAIFLWYLRGDGIAINALPLGNLRKEEVVVSYKVIFHWLWTKQIGRPGYRKRAWQVFRHQLFLRRRDL